MKFLQEGETTHIQGSGKNPYEVKKVGGVVSCSCPAWRNLGGPIDTRVCKHMKANIDQGCFAPAQQAAVGFSVSPAAASVIEHNNKPKGGVKQPKEEVKEPLLLLAHSWEDEDPTGWWISEKLDGVRALWDGEKFISRLGNVYHAPDYFKKPQGGGGPVTALLIVIVLWFVVLNNRR